MSGESAENVRRAFDCIQREIALDRDIRPTETAVLSYQVAAAREVAVQLARIGDILEAPRRRRRRLEPRIAPIVRTGRVSFQPSAKRAQ